MQPATHHCPKAARHEALRRGSLWATVALGVGSICWFLLRVVPKPTRAAYPCQRAAAGTAASFIVWLLGLRGLAGLLRRSAGLVTRSRWVGAVAMTAAGLVGAAWLVFAQPASPSFAYAPWTPTEGPNAPMGTGRGIYPGRVVWSYDPASTKWDGVNGHWWDPAAADQARVDTMMSQSLQSLTGATSDPAAWNALFTSFNQSHGRGANGYAAGQTIVIKINQNTARQGHAENGLGAGNNQNSINGDPHVILSLLRQLVDQAGVPQSSIYVYDISRYITDSIYVPCSAEFPGVHWVEQQGAGGAGREAFNGVWTRNVITYAGAEHPGTDLPQFVTQASYMINLASMKAHGDDAGPTLHAKLHYGTIAGLNHSWPNGNNVYSYFVDMMGSKYLGENTVLFMIDALYGANGADAVPSRWSIYPFAGWPSSLLVSQDGVASESVGWDLINAQWGVPAGSDNTLKEAATANHPGSGTRYAPNGDGVPLPSLGVHEHWNNVTEKKYTRNLGTGNGLELVQLVAADAALPLPRTGWVATASNQGEPPSNAIDGALNTRWTTGAAQAPGQWFSIDLGTAREFVAVVLDANGSNDFPVGYQVFASNDPTSWGTAIASGAGTSSKTTVTFAAQSARYLKLVLTAAGSSWWSISELNVLAPGGASPPPGGTCSAAPSVPGKPAATASSSSQISLTWGASTVGAYCTATYDLHRGTTSGFSPAAGNRIATGQSGTTYVDGGLAAATTYYYLVVAKDSAGASIPSAQASATTSATAPSETLLSQGKPATASSIEGNLVAANAVDGVANTRWGSAFGDPQWLQVDLGATASISRVVLSWETAYGKAYQLQVSNDGASWTNIYSTATGAGGVETLNVSGAGRYVRLNATARGTVWGDSLWEFQVYGTRPP